jgi:hypothetical protein
MERDKQTSRAFDLLLYIQSTFGQISGTTDYKDMAFSRLHRYASEILSKQCCL